MVLTPDKQFLWKLFYVYNTTTVTLSIFWTINTIQPGNYQVSKEVVHELEFGDIAVMQI